MAKKKSRRSDTQTSTEQSMLKRSPQSGKPQKRLGYGGSMTHRATMGLLSDEKQVASHLTVGLHCK
jgi:hypothetical protein